MSEDKDLWVFGMVRAGGLDGSWTPMGNGWWKKPAHIRDGYITFDLTYNGKSLYRRRWWHFRRRRIARRNAKHKTLTLQVTTLSLDPRAEHPAGRGSP